MIQSEEDGSVLSPVYPTGVYTLENPTLTSKQRGVYFGEPHINI